MDLNKMIIRMEKCMTKFLDMRKISISLIDVHMKICNRFQSHWWCNG